MNPWDTFHCHPYSTLVCHIHCEHLYRRIRGLSTENMYKLEIYKSLVNLSDIGLLDWLSLLSLLICRSHTCVHTLQLSQHSPDAHSASTLSLHVMPSQQRSFSHSSKLPQSHSSSSSTILLPQLRRVVSSFSIGKTKKKFIHYLA